MTEEPGAPDPSPAAGAGRLHGRVMVCAGGGSGIGLATVQAFLAEGASVGVLELDADKAGKLEELGERVFAIAGDATSAQACDALVARAAERWGRIDTAISFVGIFDHYTALPDIPAHAFDAAFEEVFAVNVKSALILARAAIAELARQRGSLLLTLSTSSFHPGRGGVLYVGSKFALRGVIVQLAHELAPAVRVNGVAPGGTVGTDLRGADALGQADLRLDARPGRPAELEARTPLRVALTPADHAGGYVYLASDEARGITGEIIRSDGGIGVR